jgi:Putative Actinobacterial Holin-X, holin superfamily III
MAETAAPRPDGRPGTGAGSGDETLGGLVSLAIQDVTQLVKWEIDLAKLELRDDIKRLAISGAMAGFAGFVGCLVLVMLSFAAAYGLVALRIGITLAEAFAIVAFAYAITAAIAAFVGVRLMRRLAGLRRTRSAVQDNLALLRSGERSEGAS